MWVRVRIAGDTGFLTLKGPARGMSRAEFEYRIPLADAETLLAQHCAHGAIDKVRYIVPVDGFDFEVDVFEGPLAGLVTAEIELATEDIPPPSPPRPGGGGRVSSLPPLNSARAPPARGASDPSRQPESIPLETPL